MTTTERTYTEDFVEVAGCRLHVLKGGTGAPVVVLHHDIGNPGWLPFYEALARRFTVIVPECPGMGQSERPEWMRGVRDVAVAYQWLLKELGLESPALVGLGFGGWIAAEMASMAPRAFRRLVLVGAMGIKPPDGEILDQSLCSHIDYVKAGLHDSSHFDEVFGVQPDSDQLVAWDSNREMIFRIAWRPYMYSQTLPHLLGGVETPALIVWGDDDRIVPRSCAGAYARALRSARVETIGGCGHLIEMEKPEDLAGLVTGFVEA